MNLIIFLLIGALAGWLAGVVMKGRGFGLIYANAKGFEQFMAKSNSDLGAVMKAVGLAKS